MKIYPGWDINRRALHTHIHIIYIATSSGRTPENLETHSGMGRTFTLTEPRDQDHTGNPTLPRVTVPILPAESTTIFTKQAKDKNRTAFRKEQDRMTGEHYNMNADHNHLKNINMLNILK